MSRQAWTRLTSGRSLFWRVKLWWLLGVSYAADAVDDFVVRLLGLSSSWRRKANRNFFTH